MSKRSSPGSASFFAGAFSRPLEVDRVPESGLDETIEATEAERVAIAAELGLAGLDGLTAAFRIERRAGGRLSVSGRVQAAVTQVCVVSLDPFASLIERAVELESPPQVSSLVAEATPQRSRRRQPDHEPPVRPVVVPGNDDQADPPDPIVDGCIDLGAIALEFLTLSLDLYPRKPGVHFNDVSVGENSEAAESPFAALRRLKDHS